MEEMIKTLMDIGVPAGELDAIRTRYKNDPEGLRAYVLYMRAELDDRHEYLD